MVGKLVRSTTCCKTASGASEEVRDAGYLAFRVRQHVCIVDKQDIVEMMVVPPRLRVVHIAQKWIALLLPLKPAAANPVLPELVNIFRAAGTWLTGQLRIRIE